MFGQRSHRAFLSLLCLFVLVLVPLTLSAQEPSPQQDQSNQNNVNQNSETPDQSNQTDVNKSNDVTSQDQVGTREKPSQTDPNAAPGQNQQQSTRPGRQGAADSSQSGANREEGLPSTAGELPLIALIGFACLAGAAGTQVLAKAKSTR